MTRVPKRLLLLSVSLVVLVSLGACSDDDGFTKTETSSTASTVPSATPNLDQPCSLLARDSAGALVSIPPEDLEDAQSSEIGEATLRCKYSSLSNDKETLTDVSVYVYKSAEPYNTIREANKGQELDTEFNSGFYYERSTPRELERYIAVTAGDNRLALSVSTARVMPNTELTEDQKNLPSIEELTSQLNQIVSSI